MEDRQLKRVVLGLRLSSRLFGVAKTKIRIIRPKNKRKP